MRNKLVRRVVERALGALGLVLIGLTAWAAERLESPTRSMVIVARSVLVAIGLIGRAVDRLPLSTTVPGSSPRSGRPAMVSSRPVL